MTLPVVVRCLSRRGRVYASSRYHVATVRRRWKERAAACASGRAGGRRLCVDLPITEVMAVMEKPGLC